VAGSNPVSRSKFRRCCARWLTARSSCRDHAIDERRGA